MLLTAPSGDGMKYIRQLLHPSDATITRMQLYHHMVIQWTKFYAAPQAREGVWRGPLDLVRK